MFLRGLPEKYESARQTLESQDITMEGMILRLTDIESRLREPEHVNKVKIEWMKSVKCHKCGKKGHIAKFCRPTKKNWVKKNVKNEDQASKKKPKIRQQHAKTTQELDLDHNNSKSDKSVTFAVQVEAEAAMLANEKPSSWLINSGATSHVTND